MGSLSRPESSLFDVVVIVRFVADEGRRPETKRSTSPIVEDEEIGSESVDGNPKPGNVVRSRLIVRGAMLAVGFRPSSRCTPFAFGITKMMQCVRNVLLNTLSVIRRFLVF